MVLLGEDPLVLQGNGYPLQYSLPTEFHRQRSLVGYSPWGYRELDMTERLTYSLYPLSVSSSVEWTKCLCGRISMNIQREI